MNMGGLKASLVAVTVVLTTGFATIVTTSAAEVERVRDPNPLWTDPFTDPLNADWTNPGSGSAYAVDSGQAFVPGGSTGTAWRDTGVTEHEIEIPAYKLDDGQPGNTGDSIGGVMVGLVNANNFIGYELVVKGTELRSVLYTRRDGPPMQPPVEVVVDHVDHAFAIDQIHKVSLRKDKRVITAYLDGEAEMTYTLNDAENTATLTGTRVGMVNFAGPNNYDEARAYKIIDKVDPPPPPTTPPVEESPPAPPPPAPVPTTAPAPSTAPTIAAPTSTPKPTPTSTKPTFIDRSGDVAVGADLRQLTVAPGKRIVLTTTHRGLRRSVDVGITFYVDTNASNAGPEYRVSTVPGRDAAVSVRRVPGWKAAGRAVVCSSSRTVDYTAETVKVSLAPACLGSSSRLRVAAKVTQAGVTDWAPSRRAFYAWVPRLSP